MTAPAFTLTEGQDGLYKLVFDLPGEKVNKLGVATLEELEKIIDSLAQNKTIKALLIFSGKKNIFIAGADIKEFGPAFENPTLGFDIITTGQRIFTKISQLPFPVIACLHGATLGGGCELALACSHRIATDHPKTIIGLPETSLGIIPGWGGTQRLPRLVGLKTGTEMIVTAKPVKAAKALKIGLVDALAAPEFLEEKALEFARHLRKRRKKNGPFHWIFESNPIGRALLFLQFRREIQKKTKGFYPAPLLALKVIEQTCYLPLSQGLEIEAKAFIKNAQDNVGIAKNLISLFFGQEALKKKGGYDKELPQGQEIKNAAVVGAGTMGGGIAWLFSYRHIPVRLKDISWEAIGHGTKAIWSLYLKFIRSHKLSPHEASLKFHNVSWGLDTTGFDKFDFIVESAVENLDLKRKIYAELEEAIDPAAILASNTSSLKISDLARDLKNPERFIGMHFFNPAPRMPLVEIIPGPKTSPETLATTLELAKKLGKVPLVVGDCPGFLVNRIFMAGANEAFYLLQEGVSMKQLDQAMLNYGMPMGSCELADEVGLDVAYKVDKVFEGAYGERMKVPKLLQKLAETGWLGKKGGKGFYLYEGKSAHPNPEAEALIAGYGGKKVYKDEEIVERITLAMINEASRCLEEGIVKKPSDIDLALILGTGFPPFRGGLLTYANSLGLASVYESLKRLETFSEVRFKPTAQIEELAKSHKTFS